jgi:hypothetical protein
MRLLAILLIICLSGCSSGCKTYNQGYRDGLAKAMPTIDACVELSERQRLVIIRQTETLRDFHVSTRQLYWEIELRDEYINELEASRKNEPLPLK